MIGSWFVVLMVISSGFAAYTGYAAHGNGVGGGYGVQSSFNQYMEEMMRLQRDFANNLHSYAYVINNDNARAKAESSLVWSDNDMRRYGFANTFGGAPNFPSFPAGGQNFAGFTPDGGVRAGVGTGGAYASGSAGPSGSYQTAAVYPENPNNPNVENRFQEPTRTEGDGNQPVHYGVSSYSSSSSSNINGKVEQHNEAQSTVDNNGKVSTYKVASP